VPGWGTISIFTLVTFLKAPMLMHGHIILFC
jgi:hypothetical protein